MRVYRYEGPDGKGVYVSERICVPEHLRYGPDHPTPTDEFAADAYELASLLRISADNLYFGFATEEQRDMWFPETDRDFLFRQGATLAVYEVPYGRVIVGERQCVFDITNAHRVNTTEVHQCPVA